MFSPISNFMHAAAPTVGPEERGEVQEVAVHDLDKAVWEGEHEYVEFDINLHLFPYLAKTTIKSLHADFFPKMITHIGFVIEGRDDNDLPEQVSEQQECERSERQEV